jgi:hypothetical protein
MTISRLGDYRLVSAAHVKSIGPAGTEAAGGVEEEE